MYGIHVMKPYKQNNHYHHA